MKGYKKDVVGEGDTSTMGALQEPVLHRYSQGSDEPESGAARVCARILEVVPKPVE